MSTNPATKRPLSANDVIRLEQALLSALQKNQRPFSADDIDRLEKALVHAVQNPTDLHMPVSGTIADPRPSSKRDPVDPLGPCTDAVPTILPPKYFEELKQEVRKRYNDAMNSDNPNPQFVFIIYQMMQKYVSKHGLKVYVSKEHAENGHYWLEWKLSGVIMDLIMFTVDSQEVQNWAPQAINQAFQITKFWRSLNDQLDCEEDLDDSEATVDAEDSEASVYVEDSEATVTAEDSEATVDTEDSEATVDAYDDETDVEEGGFASLR